MKLLVIFLLLCVSTYGQDTTGPIFRMAGPAYMETRYCDEMPGCGVSISVMIDQKGNDSGELKLTGDSMAVIKLLWKRLRESEKWQERYFDLQNDWLVVVTTWGEERRKLAAYLDSVKNNLNSIKAMPLPTAPKKTRGEGKNTARINILVLIGFGITLFALWSFMISKRN